jgi:hypothetical protein
VKDILMAVIELFGMIEASEATICVLTIYMCTQCGKPTALGTPPLHGFCGMLFKWTLDIKTGSNQCFYIVRMEN